MVPGKNFNRFVQALDGKQRERGLQRNDPRSENPDQVIHKTAEPRGLACADLSADQKKLFIETMRGMLAMFREDDVQATIEKIEKQGIVDRLHVSWYDGQFDIGNDKVWDTWQIEGPDMVGIFAVNPTFIAIFIWFRCGDVCALPNDASFVLA